MDNRTALDGRGSLLPIDTLRDAYEEVPELRRINEKIGEERGKLWKMLSFGLRVGPRKYLNKLKTPEKITMDDVFEAGIRRDTFRALADLSAFDLDTVHGPDFRADRLPEAGIREVVLMEDRAPVFFLNHDKYEPEKHVPLNRHGKERQRWSQEDVKRLIGKLHDARINVILGFWGNTTNRKKIPIVHRNWEALRPVVPLSDDINPLSFVQDETGRDMPFAEYVVGQYGKMKRDFDVDGLFLGDGLMGFRSFLDSDGPYDASNTRDLWTDFYARVQSGIKDIHSDSTLSAYDCMGNGPELAIRNGVDLTGIARNIDSYVFQAYGNDAWGRDYMELPGYDLERDARNIAALPPELKEKTRYTIGLGDAVEGWHGVKARIREKHAALKNDAKQGTLGVWSNDLIRKMMEH